MDEQAHALQRGGATPATVLRWHRWRQRTGTAAQCNRLCSERGSPAAFPNHPPEALQASHRDPPAERRLPPGMGLFDSLPAPKRPAEDAPEEQQPEKAARTEPGASQLQLAAGRLQ